MKKKLLFYGNCHLCCIATWLHKEYSDKFELIDCESCGVHSFQSTKNFAVWRDSVEKQREYYKHVHDKIREADFFIFQPIENAAIDELKTDFLISNVVKETSIIVPNMRFFAYPLDFYAIRPYVQYIYKNITKDRKAILDYLVNECDPNFEKIFYNSYETGMAENKRRYELQSYSCKNKIDMQSFVEENWKETLLFATHNHPAGPYYFHLITKLFDYLNEPFDLEKFKTFNYPNRSIILNVKEFNFFNLLLPNITIPSEIQHLFSPKDRYPGNKRPYLNCVKEPLEQYYA